MKYFQNLLREKPPSLLTLIWSSLSFRYIANYQRDILWLHKTCNVNVSNHDSSDLTFHLVLKLLKSEDSHCVIPLKTWIFIHLAVRTPYLDLFHSLIQMGTK
jgi:hypothetical protein